MGYLQDLQRRGPALFSLWYLHLCAILICPPPCDCQQGGGGPEEDWMDPVDQQLVAQLMSAVGFGFCDHVTLLEGKSCLEGDRPDEMEQKHLCQQADQPGEESLN